MRKVSNLIYFGDFKRPLWMADGCYVRFRQEGDFLYCEPCEKNSRDARQVRRGVVPTGGKWRTTVDCELAAIEEGENCIKIWKADNGGVNAIETAVSIAVMAGSFTPDELTVMDNGIMALRNRGQFLLKQDGFDVKAAEECLAGLASVMVQDWQRYTEELESNPIDVASIQTVEDVEVAKAKISAKLANLKLIQEKTKTGGMIATELKFMIERGGKSSDELNKIKTIKTFSLGLKP